MSEPLKLVSFKSWFIPADSRTYKALAKIGFPATRIHRDSLSVLKLVLKKHGHQAYVEPFSVYRNAFLDKAAEWCKRNGNKCKVGPKSQTYRFPLTEEGKNHARKIERNTRDFWTRWGLTGDITMSESASYVRVNCELAAQTRNPVIQVKRMAERERRSVLNLGTHRLCTSTDSRFLLWELDVKTGPEWRPLRSGKVLLTEVSDPSGVIGDLMIAFNEE